MMCLAYVEMKLIKLCADCIDCTSVYTKRRLLVHVGLMISARTAKTAYPVLEGVPGNHGGLIQRHQSGDTL